MSNRQYSTTNPHHHLIFIECEDPIEHTEGHPFCTDASCPCREDCENVNLLNDLIEQGLLTQDEAELIKRGATI